MGDEERDIMDDTEETEAGELDAEGMHIVGGADDEDETPMEEDM